MELEHEYRTVLAREGLQHLLAAPDPAAVRAYVEGLSEQEREYIGEDVIGPVRNAGYVVAPENPFESVDATIREALAASGVAVPGGTYVGEFPHQSFNAQARMVPGGTLILLNTGLRSLLDRVAITLIASQLLFRRDDRGAIDYETATPDQERRRAEADTALAEAVVAYVSQSRTDPAAAPRLGLNPDGALGFFMARSAEQFAIGHEYGHLLAGHLHCPPDGTEERLRHEYEADELAAMLILRGIDESSEVLWRGLAVAGPFLFLAVDHLVTRVRNAVYEIPDGLLTPTHPPSDERAAVLRGIFARLGERHLLQFADAWVSSLEQREPAIVELARAALTA